jgi:hypothetical protein
VSHVARIAVLLAVLAAAPSPARASCPACATGTPTLGTPGAEVPFDGRLRFVVSERERDVAYAGVTMREARTDVGASWAPVAALTLTAGAPLVAHWATDGDETFGVGNASCGARLVVLRDRQLAPRHVLSIVAAGFFPAPPGLARRAENSGVPPLALATGVASWGGTAGVSYLALDGPFSLAASVSGIAWLDGPGLRRTGPSLLGSLVGQWHASPELALRLAVDARVDATSRGALGRPDPDSGGVVLSAGPELLFGLEHWLVVVLGVRVPVVQVDTGSRHEGLTVAATVVVDV